MAGHSDWCPQTSTAKAQSQLNHAHKHSSWKTTRQGYTKARVKWSLMASRVGKSISNNQSEKHVWWISGQWCSWIISAYIHEVNSPLGLTQDCYLNHNHNLAIMKHEQHDKHHWYAWNACRKWHVCMMQTYTFPCMGKQVAWWSKKHKTLWYMKPAGLKHDASSPPAMKGCNHQKLNHGQCGLTY